jgi:capsular polysaccharide export protein
MKQHHISKYNHAPFVNEAFIQKYHLHSHKPKVLVVIQTKGDASLHYGMSQEIDTYTIIQDAIKENPNALIYVKLHPEVLTGKKKSEFPIEKIPPNCITIHDDINPLSLLTYMTSLYTKTSSMGMEALLLSKKVICYGLPFYAGWGLTEDKQHTSRRERKLTLEELFAGAYILYTRYFNPYSQQESTLIDTIHTIIKYKHLYEQNNGKLYLFGFSYWKRPFIKPFLKPLTENKIIFCHTLQEALNNGLSKTNSKLFIWGKKEFPKVEAYATTHHLPLLRVEDGFIRSVSLGSDLTKPYSQVIDDQGIYFDPTIPSRLETLLQHQTFDTPLLTRAKHIQEILLSERLSKYNLYRDNTITLPHYQKGQKVLLAIGQVEDDASIRYGANHMRNLQLLQQMRHTAPSAYIIYKPHPDTLAGNREGGTAIKEGKELYNLLVTATSLDSAFDIADEVHTITSLSGFEALIRGKKVVTYGLPFYAGWGLTEDKQTLPRRTRTLTLHELIAGTLLLYPRYIHPKTNQFCELKLLLNVLEQEKTRYTNQIFYRVLLKIRHHIVRKIQLLIRTIQRHE